MNFGPSIVTDNLIFAVDAANPDSYVNGSTTWNDQTVNQNNGTLINGATFDSSNGGSIVFDGTDDYVQFPQNTAGQFTRDVMSFEAWVLLDSMASTYPIIVQDKSVYNHADGIQIYAQSSSPKLIVRGGGGVGITSASTFALGQWHHFVFTFNSTIAQIYINGQLDKIGTIGAVTGNSTYDMYLGNYGGANLYEWDGKMASIKIYHKVLSSAEVLQNYNALKNRFV
jgi:hypothetical protein